jgi:hypothetical protein
MKSLNKFALGIALSLVVTGVFAQTNVNASTTSTNNAASQSTSANQGVNAINNFNTTTPSDTTLHEHISGITGSNQSIGLSGYAGSFSPNYCGGTAQAGVSAPYVTIAAGKPVLGEPGVACVLEVASVHTMEYSATYGNAAAKAAQAGNPDLAKQYAEMSGKLANAAVNMQCNVSDIVRKSMRDAGIDCPLSDSERSAKSAADAELVKKEVVARGESLDPFVRRREGLPVLAAR